MVPVFSKSMRPTIKHFHTIFEYDVFGFGGRGSIGITIRSGSRCVRRVVSCLFRGHFFHAFLVLGGEMVLEVDEGLVCRVRLLPQVDSVFEYTGLFEYRES